MRLVAEIVIIATLVVIGWNTPFREWAGRKPVTPQKATVQVTPAQIPGAKAVPQPQPSPTKSGAWMWDPNRQADLDRRRSPTPGRR